MHPIEGEESAVVGKCFGDRGFGLLKRRGWGVEDRSVAEGILDDTKHLDSPLLVNDHNLNHEPACSTSQLIASLTSS